MKILHVVCTYPSKEKPFEQPFTKAQVESLRKMDLDIYVYNIRGYESKLNYLKAPKIIKKLVIENDIDIIHAHYSYAGLSAIFSSAKTPILVSLMGSDLLGVPNKSGELTLRGKFDSYLSKYLVNKIDAVIVKSDRMKHVVKSRAPIHVIPNGVDFEHFKPKDMMVSRSKIELDKNTFYILFLGNPELNRKNYDLALRSFEKLKNKLPDKKIELLSPFGISSSEVVDYMNSSNLLLQTSYWEGSPNVVKEAMACNLPVYSTDVGDVKEILNNTKNCLVVNYNAEEISEKIKLLVLDYSKSNGREMINELKLEVVANKIIAIYKTILE